LILDILCRVAGIVEPFDELIYKFFGRMLDKLAPDKTSYSAL
jgi:hypothetical protein